ncbi:olfactory receptor class A-like protein 1 [Protopterus annectens]|uniref:olfactory receptor class A-like protein 1 n=1 Tax=Protopterus annectens TaxID=7888 RepID=UPI001CF98778|nr:olfactory receptor class A-like protein 1 [Protopterus annectens]
MELYILTKGIIFCIMASVGIVGNSIILGSFQKSVYHEHKSASTEIILFYTGLANLFMLLTRGVPKFLFDFGIRKFFNDPGCKFVVYVARVSRAMTICLTCFLSCFQCSTIASSKWKWAYIKVYMQTCLVRIMVGLLVMNMVACIAAPYLSVSLNNSTEHKYIFNLGYCFIIFPDNVSFQVNGFVLFVRDLLFVVLMSASSVYVLLILYKHKKIVKHIKRSVQNQQTAEGQAAKIVVTLVSLYVLFFGIDNSVWFYQITSGQVHPIISDVRYFFSLCYSSLFPFVIILLNKKIRNKLKCSKEEEFTQLQAISTTSKVAKK